MRKKCFVVIVAILNILSLVACSSDNSIIKNADNESAKEQLNIRFGWWGGKARQEKYSKIIDLFHQKYPNIKVVQEFSDFDPYFNKLATQSAGGNAPDIISMHQTRYVDYAKRGQLLPLEELIEDNKIDISGFNENTLQIGKVDGKQYLLSIGGGSKALIYNASLFERLGIPVPKFDLTWDEFTSLSKKMKETAMNPKIFFTADYGGDVDVFGYYARQMGKDFYDQSGSLGFKKEDMIEYLRYWDQLRKGGITPPAALSAEYSGNLHEQSMLVKGKSATVISPVNQLKIYQMYMEDSLDVIRIPRDPAGEDGENVGGVYLSIYANSKHKEEAAKFVDFWINDPDAAKLYLAENGPITNNNLSKTVKPLLSKTDQKIDEFQEKISPLVKLPNIPPINSSEINSLFNAANERVAFGKATIEESVDLFFREVELIIK